jgi:hypothetical protein
MHRDGDERRLLGCGAGEVGEMTDRHQIADELWAAHKTAGRASASMRCA